MEVNNDDPGPKRRTLLLINTGSPKKRLVFQRLKELPIRLVVVNASVNWAKTYVDEWILADTFNHKEVLTKVGAYLKNHVVDGVMTFWEDDVLLTSKIVDAYRFVGISYKAAVIARNKDAFRTFCEENSLPAPRHLKLDPKIPVSKQMNTLKFPIVVKPAYGSQSSYVVKAEDAEELVEVVGFLNKHMTFEVETALSDGMDIVVEEYIDGDEVDIDMLLQHGKVKFSSVSDNFQTREPFFLESGQATPSTLPHQDQKKLVEMAEEILERMGVMNGCVHFEAKMTKKGPIPIEVNLRLGGDEVYSFVKNAWRVDLIEQAVRIALGEYIPQYKPPEESYTYMASKTFIAEQSGVLTSYWAPKKFPKALSVKEFHFYKKAGDLVLAPPDGFEFLGWMTVSGDTPNDARDNLEEAYSQISYKIVPFGKGSTLGRSKRSSPVSQARLSQGSMAGKARIEKIRHTPLSKQRKLHVGVACNSYEKKDGAVEADLASVGNNIQASLEERGYRTTYIDFNNLTRAIQTIQKSKVDLVFNVCERINDSSLLEPHAASIFDALQIPYTGSSPFTLAWCIDKIRVKKILAYHDIPTPRWDYAFSLEEEIDEGLRYPLIVKPGNTDNSIGITNESVVVNKRELRRQMKYVMTELQRPVLVEEYIEGDEYDVSIMGSEEDDLRVLPLSRTIYDKLPEGYWHIYPFEAKFLDDEVYRKHLVVERPPKNIPRKLHTLISEIAMDTYTILDCHDYGRVEARVDREGNPYVLELNPNPSINIGDCVPAVAGMVGMDYGDFVEKIISLAIKRYTDKPPYYHLQPTLL